VRKTNAVTKEFLECYHSLREEDCIRKAYEFAKKKHEGQFRKSGEPFFTHPAEVARILAKLQMDPTTIAGGFLHDTVEDTDATLEEIEREFGKEVAFIVDALTGVDAPFKDKIEKEVASFRKLVSSAVREGNFKPLIVKLADRLHNMRTMDGMPRESQCRNAASTLLFYAPLAGKLGLKELQKELEELSLKYLGSDCSSQLESFEEFNEEVESLLAAVDTLICRENYNI